MLPSFMITNEQNTSTTGPKNIKAGTNLGEANAFNCFSSICKHLYAFILVVRPETRLESRPNLSI